MPLTSKDYKKLLKIIDLIYSIPNREAIISSFWKGLQKLIPFSSPAFLPMDYKTHNFQLKGIMLHCNRDKEIMNLLTTHLSRALHNIDLIETISLATGGGIIVIGSNRNPLYINDKARLALAGMPVSAILDNGDGTNPAFFHSKRWAYRIRTMPIDNGRIKTIILMEPLPAEENLRPKLINLGLSKREVEIVILAIQGFSYQEIAQRLFICTYTVKDHLKIIFKKVEVHSRSELTAKILQLRPETTYDLQLSLANTVTT